MDQSTMVAAVEELNRRGIAATFEYPGFIQVPNVDGTFVMYGDQAETFDGDHMDADRSEVLDVFPSSIPRDSEAVDDIVEFIVSTSASVCS